MSEEKRYYYEICFRAKGLYDGCVGFKGILNRIKKEKRFFKRIEAFVDTDFLGLPEGYFSDATIQVEDDYGWVRFNTERPISELQLRILRSDGISINADEYSGFTENQ